MRNFFGQKRFDLSLVWRRVKRSVDPNRFNILFLIPLAATALDDDDKPMTRQQLLDAFPGNTVVAELPTGTAYS